MWLFDVGLHFDLIPNISSCRPSPSDYSKPSAATAMSRTQRAKEPHATREPRVADPCSICRAGNTTCALTFITKCQNSLMTLMYLIMLFGFCLSILVPIIYHPVWRNWYPQKWLKNIKFHILLQECLKGQFWLSFVV